MRFFHSKASFWVRKININFYPLIQDNNLFDSIIIDTKYPQMFKSAISIMKFVDHKNDLSLDRHLTYVPLWGLHKFLLYFLVKKQVYNY